MAIKTLDEVRKELADKDLAFIGAEAHFEHRIYNAGFNAAIAEMKKRNQVLVDALENAINRACIQCKLTNLADEALKQYKESVGE